MQCAALGPQGCEVQWKSDDVRVRDPVCSVTGCAATQQGHRMEDGGVTRAPIEMIYAVTPGHQTGKKTVTSSVCLPRLHPPPMCFDWVHKPRVNAVFPHADSISLRSWTANIEVLYILVACPLWKQQCLSLNELPVLLSREFVRAKFDKSIVLHYELIETNRWQ